MINIVKIGNVVHTSVFIQDLQRLLSALREITCGPQAGLISWQGTGEGSRARD